MEDLSKAIPEDFLRVLERIADALERIAEIQEQRT